MECEISKTGGIDTIISGQTLQSKQGKVQFDAHWVAEPRPSGSGFPAIS